MQELDISADDLIKALLRLPETETVCILDSCGVKHLGSHLLIAGIDPVEILEISNDYPEQTLAIIDEKLSCDLACIFTLSYDFGLKLLGSDTHKKSLSNESEPDVFLAQFDVLIIYDYDTGKTKLVGNPHKFPSTTTKINSALASSAISNFRSEIGIGSTIVTSNFTKPEYLSAIETIKEYIRNGDTYQTNLTQQLKATLPAKLTTQQIFYRLRRDHPAPFAAIIKRIDSTVISGSPERFFKTEGQRITTSPIKGTRPRGKTADEDAALRQELLTSQKDLAENTMIVDLLRNDLGRVCEYGSVHVEKLCDLEEHPTLFHLVSTVSGDLRENTKLSDILRALFPCGSITGAPKISTMRLIDEIETADRGLSMGAIGIYVPSPTSNVQYQKSSLGFGLETLDFGLSLSVAIRTMVIRDNTATFNVGGGIVIDSDPEKEYDETLTKAKALLNAIGGNFP